MADGIRTRDHRDHNPGLYQLSYRHRGRVRIAAVRRRLRAARRGSAGAAIPVGGMSGLHGLADLGRVIWPAAALAIVVLGVLFVLVYGSVVQARFEHAHGPDDPR